MSRYNMDDDETEIMDDETPVRRPAAPRYRDDDDDDDERPVTKKATPRRTDDAEDGDDEAPPAARVIKRGWGAVSKMVNADSPFAQLLKISEEPTVVKFIEDEPYAVFRQHWVERTGKKSFICIADISDKGCPLCDAGSRPSSRFSFNVALLTSDSDPEIRSYEVGARGIDQLKNLSTNPKMGPLSKHFWAISRSGKGARTATNHQMVRDRDLPDFDLSDIDESTMKSLRSQAYDYSVMQIPTYKELLEIAAELDD